MFKSFPRLVSSTLFLLVTPTFAANTPLAPTDSLLEIEMTPEEQFSTGSMPATPESGRENAEDLLMSSPDQHLEANTGSSETDLPALPEMPVAEGVANRSTKKWDRSIPLQDREHPHFGVDVHAFLAAIGTPEAPQVQGNRATEISLKNVGLSFEWQPQFIQNAGLGVFAIGPSANLYFVDDATDSRLSIYSFGISLKYQFRYMRNQIVVPFVGYESQVIRYRFSDDTGLGNGQTVASGPALGLMVNLNWFEPPAAHTFFSEDGVRRTYVLAEVKRLTSQEAALSALGNALYFGLRMEF